jgi:hypothetical protein
MIGCIFDTIDGARFHRLIGIGKFLDTLIRRIRDRRELLSVFRLSGAIGANLPGIAPQFVWLRFLVATWSIHHKFLLNFTSSVLDATISTNVLRICCSRHRGPKFATRNNRKFLW